MNQEPRSRLFRVFYGGETTEGGRETGGADVSLLDSSTTLRHYLPLMNVLSLRDKEGKDIQN